MVLSESDRRLPLVLLTTDAPIRGSAGFTALQVVLGPHRPVVDVIEILEPEDQGRLADHAERGCGAD